MQDIVGQLRALEPDMPPQKTYKHGDILDYSPIPGGLPEMMIGPNQFLASVPGVGLVVNDVYHPDNAGYRITARSMGLLKDNRKD